MWKRLFGRPAQADAREAGVPTDEKAPDERLGPEPPPPPTSNRPGVTVHAPTSVAAFDRAQARPRASRLGPADAPSLDRGLSWAAVILSGEARGDVVVAPAGALDLPPGTVALLEGLGGVGGQGAGDAGAPLRISRDALAGKGLAGITGARVLARTASHSVLRLGPPPAARWAVVGFRSVAVFTGKLTLFDGDEGHDVWAGQVAFVADPSATLYVQAGNDTAVAIVLAAPDVLVRLG